MEEVEEVDEVDEVEEVDVEEVAEVAEVEVEGEVREGGDEGELEAVEDVVVGTGRNKEVEPSGSLRERKLSYCPVQCDGEMARSVVRTSNGFNFFV